MSQENVETIKRACEAWGTGDISIYREMYAHDVIAYAGSLAPEVTGELEGRDRVMDILESFLETFEYSELLPGEFLEDGDVVVVPILMRARPRGSTGTIEWRLVAAYRFRDGLIVHQSWHQTREEALEAAGLSE
jgi:ketosteroid isomerase-like protein